LNRLKKANRTIRKQTAATEELPLKALKPLEESVSEKRIHRNNKKKDDLKLSGRRRRRAPEQQRSAALKLNKSSFRIDNKSFRIINNKKRPQYDYRLLRGIDYIVLN